MIEIKITGSDPLEALASVTAYGLYCVCNSDVKKAAEKLISEKTPVVTAATSVQETVTAPATSKKATEKETLEVPKEADTAPSCTLEEARAKGLEAARKHGRPAVRAILEGIGAKGIGDLEPDQRAIFVSKLVEMGDANG